MEIKEIINLCEERFGVSPDKVEELPGAGSSRRYFRLWLPEGDEREHMLPLTVIATFGEDVRENEAFTGLSRVFHRYAHSGSVALAPAIYAVSESGHIYLQQDLGSLSFLDWMKRMRLEGEDGKEKIKEGVTRVIVGLLQIQNIPYRLIEDYIMSAGFGRRRIESDLDYFKNCFLRPSGVGFNEERLDAEIARFAERAADYPPAMEGFMLRDCQSRNIMVEGYDMDGIAVRFIDFQGGMVGPMIYDAISFLWQAKAGFSKEERWSLLEDYARWLSGWRDISPDQSLAVARPLIVLRLLQVLGAYGFRGLIEHKAHFIESIPLALDNLQEAVDDGLLADYPELERCCRELAGLERFRPEVRKDGLHVEILSFSYKKGYPENLTGNGGGFVFDCRGMHNPGRYEEYKSLTGRDRAVIDFLEERGEVQEFMKNVRGLVVPSVETYKRRGFSDLQVAFGCTGGRHRSVYCAESLAAYLAANYPDIHVTLIHREQSIKIRKS